MLLLIADNYLLLSPPKTGIGEGRSNNRRFSHWSAAIPFFTHGNKQRVIFADYAIVIVEELQMGGTIGGIAAIATPK
jgi:hypothetical protein